MTNVHHVPQLTQRNWTSRHADALASDIKPPADATYTLWTGLA